MNGRGSGLSGVQGQAAAIFAAALSARWIYIFQDAVDPLRDVPVGNAVHQVARAAAGAGDFASPYDAFLALVALLAGGALSGADYGFVRGFQVALGACNGVLAWLLARQILASRSAFAVGLAAALYGPSIYLSGQLLPSVLATSLVLLALLSLVRALQHDDEIGRFWLPGGLLGAAALAHLWLASFGLAIIIWLLGRRDRAAAWRLALGLLAVVLAVFLWTAWSPAGAALVPPAGPQPFLQMWWGTELLPALDPYYERQHSSLLALLMWKAGLAFPFGLVAPLALVGIGVRLRVRRPPAESALLLFLACFTAQGLLLSTDSGTRAVAVPVLLLFAVAGATALCNMSLTRVLAVGAAALLLAVGINANQPEASRRADYHYWRGYAFEQLGLRLNAVREYEAALSLDAGEMDTYYALADYYRARDDNIRSAGLYERLLRRWPEQQRARRALAERLMAMGRGSEAVLLYRELLDAVPDSAASILPGLAEALIRSGDMEGGIRAYAHLLELEPDDSFARQALAYLYSAAGRLPEAVAAYRHLYAVQGRVVEVGPGLAEVLIHSQEHEEAERVLRRVLELEPDSRAALALLGKQLFEGGRYREAATHFEHLRPLWPEDYRVYFFLARIYEELGQEEDANEAYALYTRYRKKKEREELQQNSRLVGDMLMESLQKQLESR